MAAMVTPGPFGKGSRGNRDGGSGVDTGGVDAGNTLETALITTGTTISVIVKLSLCSATLNQNRCSTRRYIVI